jgi:hypothetical protein
LLNAILGFIGGLVLYAIYALGFESMWPEKKEIETEESEIVIVSPEIKPEESEKSVSAKVTVDKVGEGKVDLIDGRPHFVPGKKEAAPENLPFVDEMISSSNMQEPSDDEVKERLNRLMRGEL